MTLSFDRPFVSRISTFAIGSRSMNLRPQAFVGSAILALFALSAPAAADLVGYWNLDENPASDGTTVADSSGATVHDGTLSTDNGATNKSVPGLFNRAFSFDGSVDQVTADLGADLVTGTGSRTMVAWFNPASITSGQNWIFSYGVGSSGEHIGLSLETDGPDAAFRARHFGGFIEYDVPSVTAGSWFHVAQLVPDGATNMEDARVFLNGVEVPVDVADSTGSGVSMNTGTSDFSIGALVASGSANWNGLLDDVGYFDDDLTDAEILAIVNLQAETDLQYNLGEANQLFRVFSGELASTNIGDLVWQPASGLGGSAGEVVALGGSQFFLNLDGTNGVFGFVVPEPGAGSLAMMALSALALRRRRRK